MFRRSAVFVAAAAAAHETLPQKRDRYMRTLGVSKSASLSKEALKEKYHKLALAHHPDKGGDPDQFQAIKTAYDALSDAGFQKLCNEAVNNKGHGGMNTFHSHSSHGSSGGGGVRGPAYERRRPTSYGNREEGRSRVYEYVADEREWTSYAEPEDEEEARRAAYAQAARFKYPKKAQRRGFTDEEIAAHERSVRVLRAMYIFPCLVILWYFTLIPLPGHGPNDAEIERSFSDIETLPPILRNEQRISPMKHHNTSGHFR